MMVVHSFDNANWPIIAAMAWIRRRKRSAVDAALSMLPDTDLISIVFDGAWDDCESENSNPNDKIVLETQNEFWRAVQTDRHATRLKLTGLLNGGRRQEIPSSDTPDMQLTERDFKYVIDNAVQCGGGVWRDILCTREDVFRVWPENTDSLSDTDAASGTSKKQKRGPSEKYDWPAMERHLDRLFEVNSDLSEDDFEWCRASHVENAAKEFFSKKGKYPASSTIKLHVNKYLKGR